MRLLVALSIPALTISLAGCAIAPPSRCGAGEQRAVSELLYFGTAKPTGLVTPEEWSDFLRSSVTRRFPKGFTVWQASGQWQSANGQIVREGSYVVSLVYPEHEPNETAVRELLSEYKSRFQQEAVLRVKSHACVSF